MKYFITTFIAILFIGIQSADAQKAWDEIEYPEINNFDIPPVETFQLDNGITFYLIEDRELPVINLNVRVRTGSFLNPNEKTGLGSVAGSVMRSGGSENYPEAELNELLENRAASMEMGIGLTSGSASMNVLKEDFDELIDVFIDLLKNPAFPQDRIDLTITQRKSGIARRNDDQGSVANREFRRIIYGTDSVYGRLTEYETLDNITRDDLVEFHEKSFVGNNMMIGLVGDFSVEEIRPTLERAFGSIPAGQEIALDLPDVDYEFESSINFIDKRDVNQSYVLLGHIGGMRDNPDYAKLQVMNQVLSGGFSSRLFQEVRTRQGLAYSVFGSYGSSNFYPGTFTAGVMTQSESTADAIDAIISEIERLQAEPVTEEELRQTKDQFLNSLVFRYDSRAGILNQRLGYEYAGLDPETFDRLVEEIREVTPADIQEVANEYLRPDAFQILVVGNSNELGDQLAKYGNVNEIDITIPEPPSDEEMVEGDAAQGQEWFTRMANAVLPGADASKTLRQEGNVSANSPMGEINIVRNEEINFSERRYNIELLNTPQGDITIDVTGNQGTISAGGQEFPLQPAQIQQQLSEYMTHYLRVIANSDDYVAEFVGMEEVQGQETVHLRLSGEKTLNYYLDSETALPVKLAYREMNPQMGGQVPVENYYREWTEQNGLMVAYTTVTMVNGEEQATATISTHSFE